MATWPSDQAAPALSVARRLLRLARRALSRSAGFAALVIVLVVAGGLGYRAYDAPRGPALALWHSYVPNELEANAIDRADWDAYAAREARLFADIAVDVSGRLQPEDRRPENRYYAGSPVHTLGRRDDWNRSYILKPDGEPRGAVVLLHGLTDAPYSLRHVAQRYRERGFVAVGVRLPGHGTVPGGLTTVSWEDWRAATRLAFRAASRFVGGKPLHVVGYSNGGALALLHALDALREPALGRPERVVLISPMVGVISFARFAGVAAWPAYLPAFVRAAWLETLPEYNPFKYNSFPVNAAVQAQRLTAEVQRSLAEAARSNRLGGLAPVLTFQSVLDSTVDPMAVVSGLHDRLPANGSELVLFDINRAARFGPLFRPATETALARLSPPAPRAYRRTVVAAAAVEDATAIARVVEAHGGEERVEPLGAAYPPDVYSLSHVALPFPPTDGLYGSTPDPSDDFGIRLGRISARGETGALMVRLDAFGRMTSNPFFDYLIARIDEGITR